MTISTLADVLWRDTNPGGNLVEWTMNGPQVTSSQTLDIGSTPQSPDSSWSVAAVGESLREAGFHTSPGRWLRSALILSGANPAQSFGLAFLFVPISTIVQGQKAQCVNR